MPTWLIILIVGVVLFIIGLAGVGKILIYIGIAVLVVSLIVGFLGRGKSRT